MSNDNEKVNKPDSVGYWWWSNNEGPGTSLAEVVSLDPFVAVFFNGTKISGWSWGEWKKAIVK